MALFNVNPNTGLEVDKYIFISVPYVPRLSENSEESSSTPVYRSSSKEPTPSNPSLCTQKDKNPSHLKQNTAYKLSSPEEKHSLSYIGKSSRCLENGIKEHSSHVTSAIYQHTVFNNHPKFIAFHFKIIDQDSRQVVRKAREAIHIKINNNALN